MTLSQIRASVAFNLGDQEMVTHTEDDLTTSIQEGYNLVCAATLCIEKSATFPQIGNQVYYDFGSYIPDFLCVSAIFNYANNKWLIPADGRQLRELRYDWEKMTGEPIWFNPVNFRYTCVVPHKIVGNDSFCIFYKAKADLLSDDSTPHIPPQVMKILENYATFDQLIGDQEYTKAKRYFSEFIADIPILKQIAIVKADSDRQLIGAPNIQMGAFATQGQDVFNDNLTPQGTIDGSNNVFILGGVPNPTASLMLQWNGSLLTQGIGYTLNGNTVTMNTGYIPQVGDTLRAWYRT
jgi:hypothetical protein